MSIPAARNAHKSTAERIFEAIGEAPSTLGNLLAGSVTLVVDGVGYVLSALLMALLAPALLFGTSPRQLWTTVRSIVRPITSTVAAVARGVVQLPTAALGVALVSLRNLFSFGWLHSGKDAIRTFTQPFIGALFVAASPLFYAVKGLSDGLDPPQPLTKDQRTGLAVFYPPSVLDRARVVQGASVLGRIMAGSADAFTLGHTSYLNPSMTQPTTATLRHEIVHSLQVDDTPGGLVAFLSDYTAEWLGNFMTDGFDRWNAYFDISYEQEARHYETGQSS